jgi:hypothetical protein
MPSTTVQGMTQTVEEISPLKVDPTAVGSMMPYVPLRQKVKVYYIAVKDGVSQIIGSVGDKIVIIQAKVQQVLLTSQATIAAQTSEAWNAIKAKTVWIQDGYVYFTTAVEGQVVNIRAKLVEPVKSCTLSCYNSSKAKMELVLQRLKPYYTKVHDGVAHIVGSLDRTKVFIQVQISNTCTSLKIRTLSTLDGARAVIDGYTSTLRSRTLSLYHGATAKIDHIYVCIKDGVVHMKGVVGQRLLQVQTYLSELAVSRHLATGFKTTKQAATDLIAKVLEVVSSASGMACDTVQRIQCTFKGGVIHITGLVNGRIVFLRIKIADSAGRLQSYAHDVYVAIRDNLGDACKVAQTRVVYATEVTKAKAIEAGTTVRSLAANPDARAAAAGAVALGASGGATGFVAGGLVGAACAVPAAFFTFGLSLPVGAAIGASSGFCVGGSVGLVSGGAAGYKIHKEKGKLGNAVRGVVAKAQACKEKVVDSPRGALRQVVESVGGTPFA